MSDSISILVTQVLAMFLMMAVGYTCHRTHMVSDRGVEDLSNVVMYVASPAVMVTSFLQPFSVEQLREAGVCVVLTTAVFAIAVAMARLVYGNGEKVSQFAVIFSNTGFVGIPLVQSVLGEEYVFYVTVCIATTTFFVWTYGVHLITGSLEQVSLTKVVTNPAVITLFVGFALYVLQVDLPDALSDACAALGALNTGAAMLVLGCYLAQTRLSLIVRDLRIYKASLLRLIASPLATILLLCLLPAGLVPRDIKMVILITFATPVAGMCAMLSQKYGANYEYGTGLISVSTLLSMVSMPLMLELAMLVL